MGKIKSFAEKWAKNEKWAELDGQNFAPLDFHNYGYFCLKKWLFLFSENKNFGKQFFGKNVVKIIFFRYPSRVV